MMIVDFNKTLGYIQLGDYDLEEVSFLLLSSIYRNTKLRYHNGVQTNTHIK